MAKKKYYVVWKGRKPGVFTSWAACQAQVNGFSGARFKSYPTKELADAAFEKGVPEGESVPSAKATQSLEKSHYVEESISVDAACSGNPGLMEYRGVYTKDGEEIFHFGPVDHGTNNIGEFLAIVHALALLKKEQSAMPIYSDSMTAISWVRKKKVNTTIPNDSSTAKLWDMIDRAVTWLHHNSYSNPLLKWDTKNWGEIKADFGRK